MDNNYSYFEIINNLKSQDCDDFVKIFSILDLDNVKSIDDYMIIINHLTNHSTPVREALSLKLDEIYSDNYFNDFIKQKYLDAIIDINPNVSRAVCNLINKNDSLKLNLEFDIIQKINSLLDEISNFKEINTSSKSHAKNKKLFSLYWLLEALCSSYTGKYYLNVVEILKLTINFFDYTIREKSAKILNKMPNPPFDLLQKAKLDQNFYVKNQVYDKITFED